MKRRILSLLLCLCMAATLLPTTARADEPTDGSGGTTGGANDTNGPYLDFLVFSAPGDAGPSGLHTYFRFEDGDEKQLPPQSDAPYPKGCTDAFLSFEVGPGGCDPDTVSVTVEQSEATLTPRDKEYNKHFDLISFSYYITDFTQPITITIAKTGDAEQAQDGNSEPAAVQPKVYTITPVPTDFSDVIIDNVTIPGHPFTPAFDPNTVDYSVKVPADEPTFTVNAATSTGITPIVDQKENNTSVTLNGRNDFWVEAEKRIEGTNYFTSVTRKYVFRVERSNEELVTPTPGLFQRKDNAVYNGAPHTDLVSSRVLPQATYQYKLIGDYNKPVGEFLTAPTESGGYMVYVTCPQTDVYRALNNEPVYEYSNTSWPLTVYISPAKAQVNGLTDTPTVTVQYNQRQNYEISLPGVTVTTPGGKTLEGSWHLWGTSDTQNLIPSDTPYPVQLGYSFKDPDTGRNWTVEPINAKVKVEKGRITADVLKWELNNNGYTYNPNYHDCPYVNGNDLNQVVDSASYTLTYSFYKDGVVIPDMENVQPNGKHGGPPKTCPVDAGTYTVRATLKLADAIKDYFDVTATSDGNGGFYVEQTYTVNPVAIQAKVWLDALPPESGKLEKGARVYPRFSADRGGLDLFDFTFKLNDQTLPYGTYVLAGTETGTFTFSAALKPAYQKNYTVGEITPATLKLDAAPLGLAASQGAKLTHVYTGDSSYSPEEFKGKILLTGLPEGASVSAEIFSISLYKAGPDGKPVYSSDRDLSAGDGYVACIYCNLTGADAGSYYLEDNEIIVPATITKREIPANTDSSIPGAPYTRITLERPDGKYSRTGGEIRPEVLEVFCYDRQTWSGDLPAGSYDVTYANNVAAGTGTVTITAKEDSNFMGSASTTFQIVDGEVPPLHTENQKITLKVDEEKTITAPSLSTFSYVDVNHTVLVSGWIEDGKLIITGFRAGECALWIDYEERDPETGRPTAYHRINYQITVTDGTGPVVPDPGPVEPDPGPVDPDPGPVDPDPGPVEPDPGPVNPDPGPGTPSIPTPPVAPVVPITPAPPSGGSTSTPPASTPSEPSASAPSAPPAGAPSEPSTSGGTTQSTLQPAVSGSGDSKSAVASVPSEEAASLVDAVKKNNSTTAAIKVDAAADVGSVTAQIPASAVAMLASSTSAALTVDTPVAGVTIPNSALAALGGASGDVTVSAVKGSGSTVTVTVQKDGQTVGALPGMKVAVPVESQQSQAGSGLVAVLVAADGTETILPKSSLDGGQMNVLLESGSATVKFVDNSKSFVDTGDHWSADAVDFVSSRDLFQGTSEGVFSPDAPMTRSMLVTVLHRLESQPSAGTQSSFQDVPADSYYAEATAWAVSKGITNGDGGSFNGDANISREQLATMLYRYMQSTGSEKGTMGSYASMADAGQVHDWADTAMRWAVGSGIIAGDNGNLNPGAPATRAQVATMLERFVNLITK